MADYLDIDKYLPDENPVQNNFSPTHDLRRDYSFNAPNFYDYLGNLNQTFRILAEYSNRNHDLIKETENTLNNRIDELTKLTSNAVKSFKDYSDTVNQYINQNDNKIKNIQNTINKNKEDFNELVETFTSFAQATNNFSDVVREYISKDLGSGDGGENLGDYTELAQRITNVEAKAQKNNDTIKLFAERLETEGKLFESYNSLLEKQQNDIKDIKDDVNTLTETLLSQNNAIRALQRAILEG